MCKVSMAIDTGSILSSIAPAYLYRSANSGMTRDDSAGAFYARTEIRVNRDARRRVALLAPRKSPMTSRIYTVIFEFA